MRAGVGRVAEGTPDEVEVGRAERAAGVRCVVRGAHLTPREVRELRALLGEFLDDVARPEAEAEGDRDAVPPSARGGRP